jgi:spoIIIJ-associated protein
MSENSSELISQLEKEGDIAADYLEGLLDIADLDGDLVVDVEGERALVSITGADLSNLVGQDGQVLNAIQDLTPFSGNPRNRGTLPLNDRYFWL